MTEAQETLDTTASREDRLAARFSSNVTRRRLLQRTMQLAAASAAFVSTRLVWPSSAEAYNCTFVVNTWGCFCASTPFCGSSRCCIDSSSSFPQVADKCCGGAIKRCSYWTTYPYCWCSESCWHGSTYGFFSCCDCWQYGGSSCSSGNTRCVCKAWISQL